MATHWTIGYAALVAAVMITRRKEPIFERRTEVFYVGLGDSFDDDRRLVRAGHLLRDARPGFRSTNR